MEQKFNIGDKVRIINYGSRMFSYKKEYENTTKQANQIYDTIQYKLMWGKEISQETISKITGEKQPRHIISENDELWVHDLSPELVGKEGIIVKVLETQGIISYALEGPSKHAWYYNDQLELLK